MMKNANETERAAEQSDTEADKVLVFIHIPKTGGLTMERLISRQYPPKSTIWMSYQRPEQVSAFTDLDAAERAKMRCVMGHIPFGFHRHIPRQAVHATLLREPVARFISEYRYMQRHPREGAWRPPQEAMESIEAYLDYRVATNAMNVQTSIVSGYFPEVGALPPFDPLPADALDVAKRNLKEHFVVVGVTERFDEALLLLKKRMHWQKSISYARRNIAPKKSSVAGISDGTIERIRAGTRIDAELVQYAEELLSQAVSGEGESFRQELAKLKRRNHMIHLVVHGWKSTPVWKIRNAPGLKQARHVIGAALDRLM